MPDVLHSAPPAVEAQHPNHHRNRVAMVWFDVSLGRGFFLFQPHSAHRLCFRAPEVEGFFGVSSRLGSVRVVGSASDDQVQESTVLASPLLPPPPQRAEFQPTQPLAPAAAQSFLLPIYTVLVSQSFTIDNHIILWNT